MVQTVENQQSVLKEIVKAKESGDSASIAAAKQKQNELLNKWKDAALKR